MVRSIIRVDVTLVLELLPERFGIVDGMGHVKDGSDAFSPDDKSIEFSGLWD